MDIELKTRTTKVLFITHNYDSIILVPAIAVHHLIKLVYP